jgi:hypothetical protein
MPADAWFTRPPPRNPKPVAYRVPPDIGSAVRAPSTAPRVERARLEADRVGNQPDSWWWNADSERHPYLGQQPLPGAPRRYVIRTAGQTVAWLGFGASAGNTKPRDPFIGWSSAQRRRHWHRVGNNARCLLLPWIHCRNLAARALARSRRRLAEDRHARYAYRPVRLETCVEKPRGAGTGYQAANRHYLGDTPGRGKLDTLHRHAEPLKRLWMYPLVRDFRRHLGNE